MNNMVLDLWRLNNLNSLTATPYHHCLSQLRERMQTQLVSNKLYSKYPSNEDHMTLNTGILGGRGRSSSL